MEVEVVFLEINKEELVKKLLTLGAEKILDTPMKQVNYKTKDDNRIRVRDEGEKIILNFKKLLSTSELKIADEYETQVVSFEDTIAFIEGMGLRSHRILEKHRESYRLGNVRFDFDKYLGEFSFVPEYLEIESDNKEDLKHAAAQVDLDWNDAKSMSTGKIIKEYS